MFGSLFSKTVKQTAEDGFGISVRRKPGVRWLSLIAVDEHKLASKPFRTDLGKSQAKRSLHVFGVGIDKYHDDNLKDLPFARSDIGRLAKAFKTSSSALYAKRQVTTLFDEQATPERILSGIAKVLNEAGDGEDIVLAFGGHGVRGNDGRYYLALTDTKLSYKSSDDIGVDPRTAIAWDEIAALLKQSRARIMIFLDSCHSGEAGRGQFSTNDNVVDNLLSGAGSNIVVFSGSKGREQTRSHEIWKGGLFTTAIIKVLENDKGLMDLNGNGVLETSEFYQAVKGYSVGQIQKVRRIYKKLRKTEKVANQTPWMARNQMVGDIALW